jgi:AraC-like DNA-binding protein
MQTPSHQKFSLLYQMLIELAMGNSAFQIKDAARNSIESDLNQLAIRLKSEIDEIDKLTNPHFEYSGIVQDIIILDRENNIKGFNSSFAVKLNSTPENILGHSITMIIKPETVAHLKERLYQAEIKMPEMLNIVFVSSDNKFIPSHCMLSTVIGSADKVVSTISINVNYRTTLHSLKPAPLEDASIQSVIKLHDYILDNLSNPLPTLKKLCRMLGTNEFTLKENFRKYYNTSIYQFYNDERLNRAQLLITQTQLPLKDIAFNCGFTDYGNFSKAFRKKFSYPPGQLLRKT